MKIEAVFQKHASCMPTANRPWVHSTRLDLAFSKAPLDVYGGDVESSAPTQQICLCWATLLANTFLVAAASKRAAEGLEQELRTCLLIAQTSNF